MIARMSGLDLPPINPRHRQVADEWLKIGNKTQAAINAGYSLRTAKNIGSQILAKPEVAAYLQAKSKELQSQETSVQQRILGELEAMAFSNIADFITIDADGLPQVDFSTATPEQLKAITAIKTKSTKRYDGRGKHIATEKQSSFNLADKYKGLELLGRAHGMFKPDEQRVTIDVADRLLSARSRLRDSGAEDGGDLISES